MDPNANLKEQLQIAAGILADFEGVEPDKHSEEAVRLAELVVTLDEWIRKDGFLPDDWRRS